jgi:hypothetical protein
MDPFDDLGMRRSDIVGLANILTEWMVLVQIAKPRMRSLIRGPANRPGVAEANATVTIAGTVPRIYSNTNCPQALGSIFSSKTSSAISPVF